MSDTIDQILFNDFGLDTDSSYNYMAKGSAPYILNVLKGEDGVHGELTNLKGNKVVDYVPPPNHPWLNANVYFTLCSCYDPLTRNVYYWVFSQPVDTSGSGDYEYDNRLLRFNEDTEVIDTIYVDYRNDFGLNPLKPFKDSFVIGDWLYFNPRDTEPKMIHIEMAYNYTNYSAYDATEPYLYGDTVTYYGGLFVAVAAVAAGQTPVTNETLWERIGDSYQDETGLTPVFDSEFRYAFNVIKQQPVFRPACTYATDPDRYANNVKQKLFRFCYRYKYFDNAYSKFSAYSAVTLPINEERYNGDVPENDEFNHIRVTINLHSAALIKEVEIAFQEVGGDWKKAKIINRRDIDMLAEFSYVYKFYNTDTAYEVLDPTLFTEVYDSVPRYANSQEIINKNILLYAGVTEGFDNINKNDIDVSLTPEIQALTIPEQTLTMVRDNLRWRWTGRDIIWGIVGGETACSISFEWYVGGELSPATHAYTIQIDDKRYTYILQAGDTATNETLRDAISAFINTSFPTATVTNIEVAGDPYIIINIENSYFHIVKSEFFEIDVTDPALTKFTGFKTGAWHPFCIFYYDGGLRRCDAQTSKDNEDGTNLWEIDGTTVYIPMFNEISPPPASTANRWIINWEVNHLPPSYAKYWRWGYAGNALCSHMWQYTTTIVQNVSPWTVIDIAPLQTLITADDDVTGWNEYPNSIIAPYTWERGDRVRIITEKSDGATMGAIVDGVYDYEIVKYEEADLVPGSPARYLIYVNEFALGDIAGEDVLIEIYRPIRSEAKPIFYELGDMMPIIEDSSGVSVHGIGSTGTQNQDSSLALPAMGVFYGGDIYHILRTPSKPIDVGSPFTSYFHESQWYSDFYDSDDWDRGRIGEETTFGERFLNIVRYSDPYLQQTLINGLTTFHGANYAELNDVYGAIQRIIENGDTLKVYQRKKPSSILIGKTQYYDAEGNANVQAVSNRVLGSIRYSSTNYGTEFPESISRNNRYIYGFDVYNGVMWRDSANGIFPISGRYESTDGGGDYKMETYFKQKAKALLVSGIDHVYVYTMWDERHKNLYVIFKDLVDEANDDALMFHEPSNKWICFTNMDQTPAGGWNQILELDYWVLTGCELGIGYAFDEDTRFASFNIITPVSEMAYADGVELIITPLAPTVNIDQSVDVDAVELTLYQEFAGYLLGYVSASVSNFSWLSTESGVGDAETTVISIGGYITSLTSFPSWLTIKDGSGNVMGVGHTVVNGETLTLYPTDDNTGAAHSGDTVVLTDTNGNTCILQLYQYGYTGVPVITITGDGTFFLYGAGSSMDVVSNAVTIYFNHDLGTSEWKTLIITDDDDYVRYSGMPANPFGIYLETGSIASKTVSLSPPLSYGDQLYAQIGT